MPPQPSPAEQLVFAFGASSAWSSPTWLAEARRAFPSARFCGCSTAGEIGGTVVTDDSVVLTAVAFERTQVRGAATSLAGPEESFAAGRRLVEALPRELPGSDGGTDPLVHVFALSDGLHVNGSDLVRGLTEALPAGITVTGGLAGDGALFAETRVMWETEAQQRRVAVVGFYSRSLKVGFGSLGGWDPFGPERLITRSSGNVLYEFDGRSALGVYKKYLGVHAAGLPATGLLYPLSLRSQSGGTAVVRTILSVNEDEQSMTFAGDVPQGAYARLMKANFDRLIDGAAGAASTGYQAIGAAAPDLALLISCVGRKLVLKQRIEEEVEGVRDVLGPAAVLAGFYSYGEISPFTPGAKCELHNQTMTITTLRES